MWLRGGEVSIVFYRGPVFWFCFSKVGKKNEKIKATFLSTHSSNTFMAARPQCREQTIRHAQLMRRKGGGNMLFLLPSTMGTKLYFVSVGMICSSAVLRCLL